MTSGAPARGELEVYAANGLEYSDQPHSVSIEVGAGGGVLRAAGTGRREEWIAFGCAKESEEWLCALQRAARLRAAAQASMQGFTRGDDEIFEPDDGLWAEAAEVGVGGRDETQQRIWSACVYDYSVSRVGWRAVVVYHVQATGYGRLEPWVVKKTHAEFRELVSAVATEDDIELELPTLDRKRSAANPQRLLSAALLGRRVELINAVLRRLVADPAVSASLELESFLAPPADAPPPPPPSSSLNKRAKPPTDAESKAPLLLVEPASLTERGLPQLVPIARVAAVFGALAFAAAHHAYQVPPLLLAVIFAAGAVVGSTFGHAQAAPQDEHTGREQQHKQVFDEDVVLVDSGMDDDVASGSQHADDDYSLPKWPSPLTAGGHCWSEPDASFFCVRGPTYLVDKVKLPSQASLFPLAAVDLFLTDVPQQHVACHPGAFVAKRRHRQPPHASLFAVNFCMPWGNLVAYWATDKLNSIVDHRAAESDDEEDAARTVFERFTHGDDTYRDARLKLIPRVVEGNWIVRRAVGAGNNAAKLSEAVKLSYFQGPDYFEVDLDIVGSPLARRILSVVRSATSTLVLDLALVIEGVSPEELPERILGAVRMHRVNPCHAPILKPLE